MSQRGKAGDASPRRRFGLRSQLVLGTALATGAFLGGYTRAFAECSTAGQTDFNHSLCSGSTDTQQSISGTPLTVTTASGFSIDTTARGSAYEAFALTGTTGLTFTDNFRSAITGGGDAIYAKNSTSGLLSITTTGIVTGVSGDGMRAIGYTGTSGLTITAADVSGSVDGIGASNFGSGEMSITATGTVKGTTGDGLLVDNASTATNLVIKAGKVSGDLLGISAKHHGSGLLTITATGMVSGVNSAGIYAYGSASATGLSITTGTVIGGTSGIVAKSKGTGVLSITSTGSATGRRAAGIYAADAITSTGMIIAAADASGKTNGIYADHKGSGLLSITATGTVSGTDADGISAFADHAGTGLTVVAAAVTGGAYGISAALLGSGELLITATGTVAGGAGKDGIRAIAGSPASGLTIEAAGVTGGLHGIHAEDYGTGDFSITATGTVTGTTGDGIYALDYGRPTDMTIDAVDVAGGRDGIHAFHKGIGALSITSSGMVTGTTDDGIRAYAGPTSTGLTIDAHNVSGGTSGVYVKHKGTGDLTIDVSGKATGTTQTGIYAYAGSTAGNLFITAGETSGDNNGISAKSLGIGALSIIANGTVKATTHAGIYAYAGAAITGGLTVEAGGVSGGTYGIRALQKGKGLLSITATGAVTGTANDGIHAYTGGAATGGMTIEAKAVTGGVYGILAHQQGSGALLITATGAVTGTAKDGIHAYAGSIATGGMTIAAAAVSGGAYGIFADHRGSGDLKITTSGAVTGTGKDGIHAHAYGVSGDLIVNAAAVSGARQGINAKHQGQGLLLISAAGAVTGTSNAGIYAYAAGTVTGLVISSAAVTGATYGIYAQDKGRGDLKVTATGTVTGTAKDGILARAYAGTTGLIINAAAVGGGASGIAGHLEGTGALSIIASGTATGTSGDGIFAYAGSTTTGLTIDAIAVTGGTDGIYAKHKGSGTLEIAATGAVSGASAAGISAYAGASSTGLAVDAVAVTGGTDGIYAKNLGTGPLEITATGAVSGAGAVGINAYAGSAATGGLTIDAVAVTGATYGIYARQKGGGDLKISATGVVTGTGKDGILAHAYAGSGLIIDAAAVTGGTSGIAARFDGTGALKITSTGPVTGGASGNGIFAQTYGHSTDLTIKAAAVSGGTEGLVAKHYGTGALSITTTGIVSGASAAGIDAYTGTAVTGGLTIAAAAVSGRTYGIYTKHKGSGDLKITATGAVTGTTKDGILAYARGTHTGMTLVADDVSGGVNGITARLAGTGLLSITSTGAVTGGSSGVGIFAHAYGSTTGLIINAADASGGIYGIKGEHFGGGALNITATGTVKGTAKAGILADNESSSSVSTTLVTVAEGASVAGGTNGVELKSGTGRDVSLDNAGTIKGLKGVVAQTGGKATISNTGTIGGTGGVAIDLTGVGGLAVINQQGGTVTGDILLPANGKLALSGGTIDGNITGLSALTVSSDTVNLDGITTTGQTNIDGGKLIIGSDSSHAGAQLTSPVITVLTGGTLGGHGTIVGDVDNGGTVAPGNSIGTLTVNGDYFGNGGTLLVEAELGGDSSPADLLVVTGDTSGSTNVRVVNLGGAGAPTVEGIKVVDVGGTSDGTFTLISNYTFEGRPAAVAGAYSYELEKNGISTPADGDWYLRSSLTGNSGGIFYQPGDPLYEAYASVLQDFDALATLQQRLGERSWNTPGPGGTAPRGVISQGLWGSVYGAQASVDPQSSTTGASYTASIAKLQAGIDTPLYQQAGGTLVGGVAVHYGQVSSDVTSMFGQGSIAATGYGLDGTLTWYGKTGFYLDAQAHVTWFDSSISSSTLGRSLAAGNNGWGYGLSVEAGQRLPLNQHWSMTPQAQLAWSAVSFDTFTDPFGAVVSLKDGGSLAGRLGLSVDYEDEWQDASGTSRSHVYGIANLYSDFSGGTQTDVSGTPVSSRKGGLSAGLGIGGSLSWHDDKYALHGEVLGKTGLSDFGSSRSLSSTVGFQVKF